MLIDSLTPWTGPLLTLVAAIIWCGLFRWGGRPATAGLALPIATLLGFTLLIGVVQASPRQLAERLPALALGALLLAAPLALVTQRWLAALMTVGGALATGWWMGGGALVAADLRAATPVMLALGLIVPLLMIESAGPWRLAGAALALAAGLFAAGSAGPWAMLGAVLAAAALGQQLVGGAVAPASARLAGAMLLAGLLAGPVLARGAPADWAAALAPLGLLLLAPRIAGKARGWRALVVLFLLGGGPVLLAWALARHAG